MRTRVPTFILLTISLVLGGLVVGTPASAATGTVSGTVELREGGVVGPFAGVDVQLLDGVGALVDQATTDADGAYSITAEEGDYTLRAEPPDATGLLPSERPVTIAPGSTTVSDFLFTFVESRVTIAGTLIGADAQPVVGADVRFVGPEPDDGDTAVSGGDGSFSVEVLERTFTVVIDASGVDARFPEVYSVSATGVVVDAPATLDVTLETVPIQFRTVDADTASPIASTLTASSNAPGPSILGTSSSVISRTVDVSVPTGTIEIPLAPGPSGTATANATDYFEGRADFAVTVAETVTVQLEPEPEPGTTEFFGRVLGPSGSPIGGVEILGERPGGLGSTAPDGTFDVEDDSVIGDGTGRLQIRRFGGTDLPDFWQITSSQVPHPDAGRIDLGDIDVPARAVTVTVVDPDGVPVPGAFLDPAVSRFPSTTAVTLGAYAGQGQTVYQRPQVATADGELSLRLFDTDGTTGLARYDLYLSPPSGVDTCTFSAYRLVPTFGSVAVNGDTNVEIELNADSNDPFCDGGVSRFTEVSGSVLLGGDPIARVFPGFEDVDVGRRGTETDANGDFTIDLVDGSYVMDVFWTFPVDVYPRLRLESTETVVVVDDREPIDLGTFDVPLQDLTVTVLDLDGRPIEGVDVSTPGFPTVTFEMNGFGFSGTSSFPGSPSTDATGVAVLPLLAGGPYTLRFSPPAGFEAFQLEDVTIPEGGSSLQVQLAYPHPPPTAAIGLTGGETDPDVFVGDVTVDIAATAADGFVPVSIEVVVDGGTPFEYTGPFVVSGLGDHTVTATVTDDGSVTGPPTVRSFSIEAAPPDDPTTTAAPTTSSSTAPTSTTPTNTTPTSTSPTTPTSTAPTSTSPTTSTPSAPAQPTTTLPTAAELPATGGGGPVNWALLVLAAGVVLVVGSRRRLVD